LILAALLSRTRLEASIIIIFQGLNSKPPCPLALVVAMLLKPHRRREAQSKHVWEDFSKKATKDETTAQFHVTSTISNQAWLPVAHKSSSESRHVARIEAVLFYNISAYCEAFL